MTSLTYIIIYGLLMCAISFTGSLSLLLPEQWLRKSILPMVAFAAGSLWGGAFFHLIPRAVENFQDLDDLFLLTTAGFIFFFILEHFIHWHHCHRSPAEAHNHSHTHDHSHGHSHGKKPLGHLILIADTVHNLVDGLGIGALFTIDIKMGITAWIATAIHEIPQEIGDFGLLIHSGWTKKQALLFNFLSSLTFLFAGILAYYISNYINLMWLVPFTAGNFIYIVAADLIPELIQYEDMKHKLISLSFFILGILTLYLTHHTH
ncbi:MAG: ZIP family metal transporter [Bacteriovoracaceae bacterium]|nr:ZIP family metal transporter [Bacteriovoracaceae bacterium]